MSLKFSFDIKHKLIYPYHDILALFKYIYLFYSQRWDTEIIEKNFFIYKINYNIVTKHNYTYEIRLLIKDAFHLDVISNHDIEIFNLWKLIFFKIYYNTVVTLS